MTEDLLLINKKDMKNTFSQLNIGRDQKTFIIAEAGINHNGDLETALRLVEAAKTAGASAIKFQTYVTEKRVTPDNPVFGVLKKCELAGGQQRKIKEHADRLGITFFSTPFDLESAEFLRKLGVPLMKIASFDIVNKQLLAAVAAAGIPTIISRGMADAAEIDTAAAIFEKHGTEYALLHCISAYPTPKTAANLNVIPALLEKYSCPIGFSDHTLDIDASIYAAAMGARIIEKHFTLDRSQDGPDHKLSADPESLATLCVKISELETMLGSADLQAVPEEEGAKIFRRPT